MIAIPAIDLRDGACVQLIGGSYDHEIVRLPDPLAAARGWHALGFRSLHVVDLDAATRRGTNAFVVRSILHDNASTDVQVAGGVENESQIADLLAAGATRVAIGTRAVQEPAWLARVATCFPGRIVVAADVRGRRVLSRGWTQVLDLDIVDVLSALHGLPLAGVLVTAVHQEGRLRGPDVPLVELVVEHATMDVYAAGGIATIADLRRLATCGVRATVIGTALYTGALDPFDIVSEFPQ